MTETTLGQRIAERRKILSLSQEAFGEKMGVSRQAAFKWESDASVPEVDKLINMSRLFGVSVGWLLGEEETGQPDTDDTPELTAQIMQAFQLPEPEPEPHKPEEPAPPPVPTQPQKTGKFPTTAIFAVIASLSLILSGISHGLLSTKLRQVTEENTALQEQVKEYDTQLTDLEDYYIALNKRIEELNAERILDNIEMGHLNTRVTELLKALGGGTELPDSTQPLPQYEKLESWSLTAGSGADLSTASLHFKATASVDIAAAAMLVFPETGRESVSSTCMTLPCTVSGREISLGFDVPTAGTYEYVLELSLANGSMSQILLEGHGLADLASLSQPTIRSTPKSVHVFSDKLYFSQGWFNIYLAVPYLTPKDAAFRWNTPKISYYHNGKFVEEYSLNNALRGSSRAEASLNFEVTTENYHMPRFTENDVHELRLEGTLTINGAEHNYSILLRSWEIRQGEFVSLME